MRQRPIALRVEFAVTDFLLF